jgi:hypothetical protein
MLIELHVIVLRVDVELEHLFDILRTDLVEFCETACKKKNNVI